MLPNATWSHHLHLHSVQGGSARALPEVVWSFVPFIIDKEIHRLSGAATPLLLPLTKLMQQKQRKCFSWGYFCGWIKCWTSFNYTFRWTLNIFARTESRGSTFTFFIHLTKPSSHVSTFKKSFDLFDWCLLTIQIHVHKQGGGWPYRYHQIHFSYLIIKIWLHIPSITALNSAFKLILDLAATAWTSRDDMLRLMFAGFHGNKCFWAIVGLTLSWHIFK